MSFDATFWVAISFVIFLGLLIYFKIHIKVNAAIQDNIEKIKQQVDNAEKLKNEAKNLLSENDKILSNSKEETQKMINHANEVIEKNLVKANDMFHSSMEIKKNNAENKIKSMKEQAIKEFKNASVLLAIDSVKKLLADSLNKSKLEMVFQKSLDETKQIIKKNQSKN